MESFKKTTHTGDGDPETGFWLPVTGPVFPAEGSGASDLQVWMEYDPDYERFLGALDFGGPSVHLEVLRLGKRTDGDPEVVKVPDWYDAFVFSSCEDVPQTFTIDGYEGDWFLLATPFA